MRLNLFLKKYIGEILVVLGSSSFFYYLLDISYETSTGLGLDISLDILDSEQIQGAVYYYSDDTRFLITVSMIILMTGFMIILNKKK
jgi:hypothetical protein